MKFYNVDVTEGDYVRRARVFLSAGFVCGFFIGGCTVATIVLIMVVQ